MIIETESARYVLDLVAMRLKRYPRDSPVFSEAAAALPPAAVAQLRKDGDAIPFQFLGKPEVGKPAQFLLQIRDDGVPTIRTTTLVLNITGGL